MNYKSLIIALLIGIPSILQLYTMGDRLISGMGGFSFSLSNAAQVSVTVTPEPTKQEIAFVPERIVMEAANIDLPVVSQPLKNGTWDVTPKVANFAEGTSLVNEKEGNVGIFGHARPDAFLRIKQLEEGDIIIVYGKTYRGIYSVSSIGKVEPNAVEVFYPETEPTLTLTTCDGRWDEQRYVVKAKLIKMDKIEGELTTQQ